MSYSFNKFVNNFVIVNGFIFCSFQYSVRLLFVFYKYLADAKLKPINKSFDYSINILIVIAVIPVLFPFCFYTRGKLRRAIEDQMRNVEIHTFVEIITITARNILLEAGTERKRGKT
jgi:hypothetical protein